MAKRQSKPAQTTPPEASRVVRVWKEIAKPGDSHPSDAQETTPPYTKTTRSELALTNLRAALCISSACYEVYFFAVNTESSFPDRFGVTHAMLGLRPELSCHSVPAFY